MAEFKAGTREQVKNGQAQYVAGDIVAKDAKNYIGGTKSFLGTTSGGEFIRSKSVTVVTGRTDSGKISSSKTILYLQQKNGNFLPGAVKKDGEWSYSDPDYPLMKGVASETVQSELANKNSDLNKVTNNGISAELGKRQDVLPEDRDTILGAKQNHSSPADAPSGLEGNPLNTDTSTLTALTGLNKQENTGTRKKFGNLIFPNDLGSSTMDVIKFDMLEFKPRGITSKGALGGVGKRDTLKDKNRTSIGSVTLPIPAGIQDQNQAGWGDGRLNPIQVAGVGIAMDAFNKSLGDAANTVAGQLGNVSNNSGELQDAVKGYFTAAAVGVPIDQILARTRGQVLNPNLELLFNGPVLRPFNFTFKMSARDDLESKEIVKIIRFFKQGMSPQRTDSNLFVKAPHTFQLQYRHRRTEDHNFLNQFKECALIGLSVNYTPENNYATFEDGAMVSYEMQMQFKELDPVYNEDYGNAENAPDTEIGF